MKSPSDRGSAERDAGALTLGWQVNNALLPRYWLLTSGAKPGAQSDSDLVRTVAADVGCHTAIVAQSGSGKSFFLGRLLEEILINTKARCVVFDPNADFRRVQEVVSGNFWNKVKYDPAKVIPLPHETSRKDFEKQWAGVEKRLLADPLLKTATAEAFQLYWPSLSVVLLTDDAPQTVRGDLYHCHEFVKAVADLLAIKHRTMTPQNRPADRDATHQAERRLDLISEANRILRRAKLGNAEDRREAIQLEFSPDSLAAQSMLTISPLIFWTGQFLSPITGINKEAIQHQIDRAVAAVEYISDEGARHYFGKAREYVAQGIVRAEIGDLGKEEERSTRLEVIDLPSFPDLRTRLLALNSVLATVWQKARVQWAQAVEGPHEKDLRVPTFIIVDEAHNLIPSDPRSLAAEALREQFRLIAAEGRKYGLFLILCTQRPDKIDPLVLSECENRAIMRLGARSVLEITEKLFGLEDIPEPMIRKCLEFELGRALLIGRWARSGPEILYTAMRRTVEGGRNLREDHWAVPEKETAKKGDQGERVKGGAQASQARSRRQRARPMDTERSQAEPAEVTSATSAGNGNPAPPAAPV